LRLVTISKSIVGNEIATDVKNSLGQIILPKRTKLSNVHVKRLVSQGIKTVYILDEISKEINEVGLINRNKKRDMIKKYSKIQYIIKRFETEDSFTKKNIIASKLDKLIEKIAIEIRREVNPSKKIDFIDTNSSNYYVFEHMINVAIYVNYLTRLLKYNPQKQLSILKSALTYDIGMLFLDNKLLLKKGKLNEKEKKIIENHSFMGYQFLDEFTNLSLLEKLPALQHHKWLDGSGYPSDIKYKELHEFTQIIALADVFEAMTTDRPYRHGLTQSEAIKYITNAGELKFNKEMVLAFSNNIILYSKGTKVKLSDRSIGYVTENYNELPRNPKVLVIKSGEKVPVGYVDLKKYENVTIKEVVLN
jgi:HD-GYP domain-containing protein (c-di-GMP phosphodiesterase class II)